MAPADERQALLRQLPKVDTVLDSEPLAALVTEQGRGLVAYHVRRTLDALRTSLLNGGGAAPQLDLASVSTAVAKSLHRDAPLPRVLNATGVILHSGLGRAPMAPSATAAITRAGGYSLLEVDRAKGARHARDSRAAAILCELTGAEDALVVNNNAAATLLILSTIAGGLEVICSRGEMVEIGGSFRIPDVMEASGCKLVAVGTTNKTHLEDYERAITEQTGALLVVHTSNYRIVGFTSSPPLSEISKLSHERGLPCIHDLGSGSLLSPEELGMGDEPPVGKSLSDGADVVCMSGDKLLGGPQAGIILGTKDLVGRMRRHPLARALRVDKMAVAALEATLALFLDRDRLVENHPVTRMISQPIDALRPRAEALATAIRAGVPEGAEVEVISITSETGSGALPTLQIPSVAVALKGPRSPDSLARALRENHPAVFTRIHEDRVCLDVRTLLPGEAEEAAAIVVAALTDNP